VTDVDVAILHLEPDAEAGPLTRATHVARLDLVERHRRGFLAAGATRVTLHAGPRDDVPFGARLRHLVAEAGVGQMVYGTDYPFDWPVGIDFVVNAPFLSNAEKEAILGGNAIKLLKITT